MYFLNEISAVRTANQVFQILLTCSFNFFSDSISILVSRVHNRALNLSTLWLTLAGVIQNICINIHYIQCITYQCNTMYRHGRISMRGYWGWGPCPHPPPSPGKYNYHSDPVLDPLMSLVFSNCWSEKYAIFLKLYKAVWWKPMFQGNFSKINLYQYGQIFPKEIISGGSQMLRFDAPQFWCKT